jgi:hypothetical protein
MRGAEKRSSGIQIISNLSTSLPAASLACRLAQTVWRDNSLVVTTCRLCRRNLVLNVFNSTDRWIKPAYRQSPPRRGFVRGPRYIADDPFRQYAFRGRTTSKTVRIKIIISSPKLQLLMYQRSKSRRLFISATCAVPPREPLICAQPVIPGLT